MSTNHSIQSTDTEAVAPKTDSTDENETNATGGEAIHTASPGNGAANNESEHPKLTSGSVSSDQEGSVEKRELGSPFGHASPAPKLPSIHVPADWHYNQFLGELADELTAEDLKKLKFRFSGSKQLPISGTFKYKQFNIKCHNEIYLMLIPYIESGYTVLSRRSPGCGPGGFKIFKTSGTHRDAPGCKTTPAYSGASS